MRTYMFFFFAFLIFSQSAFSQTSVRTCGLSGTVAKRIENCARPIAQGGFGDLADLKVVPVKTGYIDVTHPMKRYFSGLDAGTKSFRWQLVSRTGSAKEIWYDSTSGFVWSENVRQGNYLPWDEALQECLEAGRSVDEKSGLALSFRLPTEEEIKAAETHGIRDVLPDLRNQGTNTRETWTSSTCVDNANRFEGILVFSGESGLGFCYPYKTIPFRARCVASVPR